MCTVHRFGNGRDVQRLHAQCPSLVTPAGLSTTVRATTFECSVANAGWLALPMTCNEQKLAKALSSVCTTDSETVKCCIAYVTEASALIFGNAAAHCKLGQPYPQSVPSSLECFLLSSEADTKRSDSIGDGRVG